MEWQKKNIELAQCAVNRKLLVYYNGFLAVNGGTASGFRVSAEAIIGLAGVKKKLVE